MNIYIIYGMIYVSWKLMYKNLYSDISPHSYFVGVTKEMILSIVMRVSLRRSFRLLEATRSKICEKDKKKYCIDIAINFAEQ